MLPQLPSQALHYNSLDVELEIELPSTNPRRKLTIFIGEGEAQLDDPEQVDVAPEGLVMVVAGAAEGAYRPSDYAGELRVLFTCRNARLASARQRGETARTNHGDETVAWFLVDSCTDVGKLFLHVLCPHLANSRRFERPSLLLLLLVLLELA